MTFWGHTAELGQRLKIGIFVLVVSTVVAMVFPANLAVLKDPMQFYEPLIAVVLRAVRQQVLPSDIRLIGLELVSPIEIYLIASVFFGFVVTAPVFAFQIFRFIDPALRPNERADVYPFFAAFVGLFVGGLAFGYLFLVPYGLSALLPFFSFVGAEMVVSVGEFYQFIFFLTLMTGLAFTFPVFLVLLVKYGIMGTRALTKNRKYVYVGLLAVVFVVTPGEGGLANLFLFVTMIALLEIGLLVARRFEKKGEIKISRWFTGESSCKFCGMTFPEGTAFCPSCRKSQR
jgi:sec-independent protein translocase protein TatC